MKTIKYSLYFLGLALILTAFTACSSDDNQEQDNQENNDNSNDSDDTDNEETNNDLIGDNQGDLFGYALDLNNDGSRLVIGAPINDNFSSNQSKGYTRIFENNSGLWQQLGSDLIAEDFDDGFGSSVSFNTLGNIVAVGAPKNNGNGGNSGHVRVFHFINNSWEQIGSDIDGTNPNDRFGYSVSLNGDGTIVAVGSESLSNKEVRIFQNNGGNWQQLGNTIDAAYNLIRFGTSVSLNDNGNILAIRSVKNDSGSQQTSVAQIFENIGGQWQQIGQDIIGDDDTGDNIYYDFSSMISINNQGNIVAVSFPFNDVGGRTKVFENISGTWQQIGNDIIAQDVGDVSGASIDLNDTGNLIAIGSPFHDEATVSQGHVRVFENQNNNWMQIGSDVNGNGGRYGSAVGISGNGNILSVGAPGNFDEGSVITTPVSN